MTMSMSISAYIFFTFPKSGSNSKQTIRVCWPYNHNFFVFFFFVKRQAKEGRAFIGHSTEEEEEKQNKAAPTKRIKANAIRNTKKGKKLL